MTPTLTLPRDQADELRRKLLRAGLLAQDWDRNWGVTAAGVDWLEKNPMSKPNIVAKPGQIKVRLLTQYCGHGKRWGMIRFANGFTLRAGRVALHIWRLGANDCS